MLSPARALAPALPAPPRHRPLGIRLAGSTASTRRPGPPPLPSHQGRAPRARRRVRPPLHWTLRLTLNAPRADHSIRRAPPIRAARAASTGRRTVPPDTLPGSTARAEIPTNAARVSCYWERPAERPQPGTPARLLGDCCTEIHRTDTGAAGRSDGSAPGQRNRVRRRAAPRRAARPAIRLQHGSCHLPTAPGSSAGSPSISCHPAAAEVPGDSLRSRRPHGP